MFTLGISTAHMTPKRKAYDAEYGLLAADRTGLYAYSISFSGSGAIASCSHEGLKQSP
jgi:hypothetical protein